MISAGLATMTEIDRTLGLEDIYDLLEIVMVDAANKRLAAEHGDNH